MVLSFLRNPLRHSCEIISVIPTKVGIQVLNAAASGGNSFNSFSLRERARRENAKHCFAPPSGYTGMYALDFQAEQESEA